MAKVSFDKRVERRDRLIGLLRSEDYWKTSELRNHLGISQRTLMRELAELREAGYPIESDRGRGGGVRLQGRWGVERLHLNHKEVVELVLALAVMESLKSPILTGNLKAIRQKLFQAFPQEQRRKVSNIRKRIMIGDNASANMVSRYVTPKPRVSEDIAESFLRQNCLEIEYQTEANEQTVRVIEAQYILLNWPIWYILAWDHMRDSTRIFRIDRIQKTCVSNDAFKLRPKQLYINQYTPFFQAI
ncbi:MAG: transcriptional regulator [SAR86 cluster bacterium]|uniref:Transcriptional regulator n=1 Tax=SAR86 cluster bacterium TaxID=2030880 RepID=A0A2A5AVQ7_9GAMM|nr:MAG: transcriptional regulator [SAR86 cluster bacterium]